MPADRDAAVRLVCRRLKVPDEAGLPAYARERVEAELRPLAGSPLTAPDDPLLLATAEAIARDWLLGVVAQEIRGAAREALDASRAWAELRHREITAMDTRRATMDQRQRDQDNRQAALDERQAALDARQARLDELKEALAQRTESLEKREARVTERERILHAREAALTLKDSQARPRPEAPGIWGRIVSFFRDPKP